MKLSNSEIGILINANAKLLQHMVDAEEAAFVDEYNADFQGACRDVLTRMGQLVDEFSKAEDAGK